MDRVPGSGFGVLGLWGWGVLTKCILKLRMQGFRGVKVGTRAHRVCKELRPYTVDSLALLRMSGGLRDLICSYQVVSNLELLWEVSYQLTVPVDEAEASWSCLSLDGREPYRPSEGSLPIRTKVSLWQSPRCLV